MLLAFLALHALIGAAWWRWLRSRAEGLAPAERLLCVVVLSVAQVVAVSLILGWCGLLQRGLLLLAVPACSAAVLLGARPAPVLAARGGGEESTAIARALRFGVVSLRALFGLVLLLVIARGTAVTVPGSDGLKYHLPMSALMLQSGRLDFPHVHNPVIAAYPKSVEIWSHWILAFFGSDRWVDLAQLPFLLLAMLATFCAARRLGSHPAAAEVGAMFLPFSPVVLAQVTTAYTDVAVAGLLLCAVALALVARRETALALPLSLGATLGLLLGTKFSALIFVTLLFAAYALAALLARGRRALSPLLLAGLLTLSLGGDTYLRNWLRHGNPVFPYRTSVAGLRLPGPWTSAQVYGAAEEKRESLGRRLARSWGAYQVVVHSGLYGGFGLAWPFLAGVIAVSLAVAVRERAAARLALFALFAALFAVTPLNFRVRFVIWLLGLGGIALAHVLDRAGVGTRWALITATVGVAVFSTAQVARRDLRELWHDPAGRAARADPCFDARPKGFREAYAWLRGNAARGSTVLVFPGGGELLPYCLWTPDFRNRVEFVDAPATETLGDFHGRTGETVLFLPRRSPAQALFAASDPGSWEVLLSNKDVTLARPRAGTVPPGAGGR